MRPQHARHLFKVKMKKTLFLLTLFCVTSLACSFPGLGLAASVPSMASPIPQATSTPILLAPTLRRLPTSEPTLTPTPTMIVPTASLDLSFVVEPTFEAPAIVLPPSLIDVTYCTMGGVELKMDAYFPDDRSQPVPVVVYVHGGGWAAGDKHGGPGPGYTVSLLQNGFAVFSINYRLAPEFLFPAMIQDVKCAIRSIRAHAAQYGIDPNRIGVWGGSAGGHLVALLGTSDESAGFDVGEYLEYSSRAQVVVDMFGPTDLTIPVSTLEQLRLIQNAFPINMYAAGSPVTYISPDDPPFLIVHGDKDKLVPVEQSILFYDQLAAQNVPATLVIVKNAGHGFNPVDGVPDPGPMQIAQTVIAFFIQYLK